MLRPARIAIALAISFSIAFASATIAAPDSMSIVYDSVGRAKQITFANGTVVIYNYDAVGNLNLTHFNGQ